MNILQKITLVFTLIGGINWGLIGIFKFNLVSSLLGEMSTFSRIIYSIISICALINIALLFMDLDSYEGDKLNK